jgi:hypothetical protein
VGGCGLALIICTTRLLVAEPNDKTALAPYQYSLRPKIDAILVPTHKPMWSVK